MVLENRVDEPSIPQRLKGILLGTAVGDALGLPSEGLSQKRVRVLFPGPRRHQFLLGRGMQERERLTEKETQFQKDLPFLR